MEVGVVPDLVPGTSSTAAPAGPLSLLDRWLAAAKGGPLVLRPLLSTPSVWAPTVQRLADKTAGARRNGRSESKPASTGTGLPPGGLPDEKLPPLSAGLGASAGSSSGGSSLSVAALVALISLLAIWALTRIRSLDFEVHGYSFALHPERPG